MLSWNKALWLAAVSNVTIYKKSEYFISEYSLVALL